MFNSKCSYNYFLDFIHITKVSLFDIFQIQNVHLS